MYCLALTVGCRSPDGVQGGARFFCIYVHYNHTVMKRKLTLLSLIALALFSLSACSKTDPEAREEKYYTEAQEQVFAIMHGTFKYEFYGITTTVSFGQIGRAHV